MTKSKSFGVSLGNGEVVKGIGECKGVLLQLKGVDVAEDFLPFGLGNTDVLLGVQWLEKLGAIVTNWELHRESYSALGNGYFKGGYIS